MRDIKDLIEHENDYDDTKDIEKLFYPDHEDFDDDNDDGDDFDSGDDFDEDFDDD